SELHLENWTSLANHEAIPLNSNTFKHDLMDTPFIWKTNGMKYLGINIVSPITKIFSLNGPGIFQSIKEDISRWTLKNKQHNFKFLFHAQQDRAMHKLVTGLK
uniref:Uncharacterized protein n=1 Tax=Gadus morhua TaxID=8049 RepID=A0A8C5AI67_GADMO